MYSGIVHTIELYLILDQHEIKAIRKKHHKKIYNDTGGHFSIDIGDATVTVVNKMGFTCIKVDLIRALGKADITSNDLGDIGNEIERVILALVGASKLAVLKRFDYRIDVKFKDKMDIEFLMGLYKKTRTGVHTLEKQDYPSDETLYYKSKSKYSSVTLNIYDKEKQLMKQGKKPQSYEENIIRYEIQLRNRHLNYKKSRGYSKDISTYLNGLLLKEYVNRYIKPITYTGNYYDINSARKIIQSKVKGKSNQIKLIEFLKSISRGSVDTVLNNGKHSTFQYKTYVDQLSSIDINPILIPKNKGRGYFENPLYKLFKAYPF